MGSRKNRNAFFTLLIRLCCLRVARHRDEVAGSVFSTPTQNNHSPRNGPIEIEGKWSARISMPPTLQAFRRQCPNDKNFVLGRCPAFGQTSPQRMRATAPL